MINNTEFLTNAKTLKLFLKTLKNTLKDSLNPNKKYNYAKQSMPWAILMTFYDFGYLNNHNCNILDDKLIKLTSDNSESNIKYIDKFINLVNKYVNLNSFITTNKYFIAYRNSLLMIDVMRNTISHLINDIWQSLINFNSSNQVTIDFSTTQKTEDIVSDEWEIEGVSELDKALNDLDASNNYGELFDNGQINGIQMDFASKILQDLSLERHILEDNNPQAFSMLEFKA